MSHDDISPGPWNVCVVVRRTENVGMTFVSTAKHAALLLANEWPVKGPAFQDAVSVCAEVMKSWSPTYLARIAFDEAVKEAGLG